MELDKLEELLALLQRYGLKTYSDKNVNLEFSSDAGAAEDFQVMMHEIQMLEDDPEPAN